MSRASNACILGLASTCRTLKHATIGHKLGFVAAVKRSYGGRLLRHPIARKDDRKPHGLVACAREVENGRGYGGLGVFKKNLGAGEGFESFGPSLQRGRRPDRALETEEGVVNSPQEDASASGKSELPKVKGGEQNGRGGGGAESNALDKLHEAWEKGTWGGEKLTNKARTKLELGLGWRADAALVEYDTWAKRIEQREAALEETNLVNAKELMEKLVQDDGWVKKFLKGADLDRASFTRSYDLAALRVLADDCGVHVAKLKGHLLNWPRVKNVARVEGDEGDSAMKSLLWEDDQALDTPETIIDSVRSAVYADEAQEARKPRKKRRFSNLDRLTRGGDTPLVELQKARSRGPAQQPPVRGASRKAWEEGAVTVEVVEPPKDSDDELERWREATRLLLLDERHGGKPEDELPQAVQMALEKEGCELVQCRLTLAYDYWPMDEILREVLPAGMTIPSAYESVGHIAHLNLRSEHLPYRHTIAQIVLEKNKPRIRTVVNKTDVIHNKYRTMQLELLAGNSSLITTLVEHGLSFRVDLAAVYWNSRLATERQRLIDTFVENDIVCDMFAGVGPIAVAAAKKVKYVYANDLNPAAVTYMQHNLILNKLAHKAEVSNKDGREFVQNLLARDPPVLFSQVVMNLPLDAAEFLDVFVCAFARDIWERRALPKIHVYGFSKAANPEAEYCERIADILTEMPHPIHVHRVRLVAPGKWMLCASFRLPAAVAFAEPSSIREFA